MRHRVGHRAMPERSDQAPLAVHGEMARGPHGRKPDGAGKDGVRRGVVADGLGNLLWVDWFAAGPADREPIEVLAYLAVMFRGPVKMGTVARLLDERQHAFNGRANVAYDAEID